MKNTYTGLKADEMIRTATATYTTETEIMDPWWGKNVITVTHVVINGKTYTKETDRDGWPVLYEEEAE